MVSWGHALVSEELRASTDMGPGRLFGTPQAILSICTAYLRPSRPESHMIGRVMGQGECQPPTILFVRTERAGERKAVAR